MTAAPGRRRRDRGEVETLPSGALRVRVYAGVDPVSGKRHSLVETIPAGAHAKKQAEKARVRLLTQVDERRNPRTKATVNQLMDRYLSVIGVEHTTRVSYEGYIRNHIRPLLGDLAVGRLDGEILDSFYAQLRTCRAHCRGRRFVQHRTVDKHDCDGQCRPHTCRPLAASTVHQIHGILSGACKRAVRWRWIGTNPVGEAEPQPSGRPDPRPPTPEQAARIAAEAWKDPDWGMLIWLAMMTGTRRGELCALAWERLDYVTGTLTIRSSVAQSGGRSWEKDTKTHQRRRIALDEQTLALMRAYQQRRARQAAQLGVTLRPEARIFSLDPDGSTWLKPASVGQRYVRMCARLGWDMNIHQLRHYSATELIAAGVDVRTVAGRLGHGGGGATTLRVYSAWKPEADQRAAGTLADRMPAAPAGLTNRDVVMPMTTPEDDVTIPYRRIASDLRAAIACGALRAGDPLPTVAQLAARYDVASSTAHRAVTDLSDAGEILVTRGKRAVVAGSPPEPREVG